MGKVTFEYDDNEEREDISLIVNRYKMINAIQGISDLYNIIYNGKIYDKDIVIYLKQDGTKATDADYEEVSSTGNLLKGGKNYINQEWLEYRLDGILEDVKHLL